MGKINQNEGMVFKLSSPLGSRIISFESCGRYQVIVVLDTVKALLF